MKKIFLISILYLSLHSCTKEDVSSPKDNTQAAATIAGAASGMDIFATCDYWNISLFTKNGIDNTKDYSPLKFQFCPDNTVTLSNDILSFNGHWYVILDKGEPGYLTLDFDFRNQQPYWTDLDGTWDITNMTTNSLRLEMANTGRVIVFERSDK